MTSRLPGTAFAAAALAAVLAGCAGGGPNQCAPCPPAAYVNLVGEDGSSPVHLVGGTARVCVDGLPCEDLPARNGTVPLHLGTGVSPQDLDGVTVTVRIAPSTDELAQRGTAVLTYREQRGECACSGVSAQVPLNGT